MTKQELEEKLEQTEKALADYQFNYPSIKELEQENAALKNEIVNLKGVIESLMNGIILCMLGMFLVGMFFGFELGRIVK